MGPEDGLGYTGQGRWGKQVHQGGNRVCVQGQWLIWGVVLGGGGGHTGQGRWGKQFIREEIVYAYKVSGGSGVWCWGGGEGGILDRDAGENKFIREEIVYAYKVSGGSGVWCWGGGGGGGHTGQGRWGGY